MLRKRGPCQPEAIFVLRNMLFQQLCRTKSQRQTVPRKSNSWGTAVQNKVPKTVSEKATVEEQLCRTKSQRQCLKKQQLRNSCAEQSPKDSVWKSNSWGTAVQNKVPKTVSEKATVEEQLCRSKVRPWQCLKKQQLRNSCAEQIPKTVSEKATVEEQLCRTKSQRQCLKKQQLRNSSATRQSVQLWQPSSTALFRPRTGSVTRELTA